MREGIVRLREAFSHIHGRYAASGYVVFTGNRTLDALLTYKFGYAKECGIAVTMEITANASQVEDGDLCVILGNLLDNAIEACCQMPDGKRELELILSEKENFLYLALTNTTDGTIREKSGKDERDLHGIGLKSVRKTVEKYGGMMRYEKTEKERLTVEVLRNSHGCGTVLLQNSGSMQSQKQWQIGWVFHCFCNAEKTVQQGNLSGKSSESVKKLASTVGVCYNIVGIIFLHRRTRK